MMTRFVGKMFPRRSPLRLIYEHALLTGEAANHICNALRDHFLGKDVSEISVYVDNLEDKADELKIVIREEYSRLKFVYFDRTDMLIILHELDAIMDTVDDFLKALMINRIDKPLPNDVFTLLTKLAEQANESVQLMVKAVEDLTNYVESSFSRVIAVKEETLATRIESDETQTDKLSLELGRKLYELKNEIHPIDWFYIEKLARLLTRMADHAENAAERIRMITHM